jgi:hypothetical protein
VLSATVKILGVVGGFIFSAKQLIYFSAICFIFLFFWQAPQHNLAAPRPGL